MSFYDIKSNFLFSARFLGIAFPGMQWLFCNRKQKPYGRTGIVSRTVSGQAYGVACNAEGKEFDPNFHNAVIQVENEDLESGTVASELIKGYLYKGNLYVKGNKVKALKGLKTDGVAKSVKKVKVKTSSLTK